MINMSATETMYLRCFYEISTGWKMYFKKKTQLLQLSLCTGTVVAHARHGCNMLITVTFFHTT